MQYSKRSIAALEAAATTAKKHGVADLAKTLGVNKGTLYSDLSKESIGRRTNKLGLLDYIAILEETSDTSSLIQLCANFNLLALEIPQSRVERIENWLRLSANIARESGEAITTIADAIEDGKVEKSELQAIEKECYEALLAFGRAYLTAKNALDAMEGSDE